MPRAGVLVLAEQLRSNLLWTTIKWSFSSIEPSHVHTLLLALRLNAGLTDFDITVGGQMQISSRYFLSRQDRRRFRQLLGWPSELPPDQQPEDDCKSDDAHFTPQSFVVGDRVRLRDGLVRLQQMPHDTILPSLSDGEVVSIGDSGHVKVFFDRPSDRHLDCLPSELKHADWEPVVQSHYEARVTAGDFCDLYSQPDASFSFKRYYLLAGTDRKILREDIIAAVVNELGLQMEHPMFSTITSVGDRVRLRRGLKHLQNTADYLISELEALVGTVSRIEPKKVVVQFGRFADRTFTFVLEELELSRERGAAMCTRKYAFAKEFAPDPASPHHLLVSLDPTWSSLTKAVCIATNTQRFAWLTHVAEQVASLHKQGLVHRNLCAQHILISLPAQQDLQLVSVPDGSRAKVTEFGVACPQFSTWVPKLAPVHIWPPETVVGHPLVAYGPSGDVWQFGLLVAEVFRQCVVVERVDPEWLSRQVRPDVDWNAFVSASLCQEWPNADNVDTNVVDTHAVRWSNLIRVPSSRELVDLCPLARAFLPLLVNWCTHHNPSRRPSMVMLAELMNSMLKEDFSGFATKWSLDTLLSRCHESQWTTGDGDLLTAVFEATKKVQPDSETHLPPIQHSGAQLIGSLIKFGQVCVRELCACESGSSGKYAVFL
jgi:hypothetical protein